MKTKFNLENLIRDGSLSLIGYAAVKWFNAFGYASRKYQNINILRVAEYPVREKILKSHKGVTSQKNVTRLSQVKWCASEKDLKRQIGIYQSGAPW